MIGVKVTSTNNMNRIADDQRMGEDSLDDQRMGESDEAMQKAFQEVYLDNEDANLSDDTIRPIQGEDTKRMQFQVASN